MLTIAAIVEEINKGDIISHIIINTSINTIYNSTVHRINSIKYSKILNCAAR